MDNVYCPLLGECAVVKIELKEVRRASIIRSGRLEIVLLSILSRLGAEWILEMLVF